MVSIPIFPASDPPIPASDSSGSPRVITNENGVVTSRKDFMAYGEEAASANRVSGSGGNGYDPTGTRKDYTGYEKDSETGLEYAQARYYNPVHGRYTSIDPMTASATIKDPQTFNRYSYVLNSPYKFVDPLGLISQNTGANGGGAWCLTCQTTDEFEGGFVDPPTAAQPAGSHSSEPNQTPATQGTSGDEHQEAEPAQPAPGADDPQWVKDVQAAFPTLTGSELTTVNTAITDAQNSISMPYDLTLVTQFRTTGDTTTSQMAMADVTVGGVVVTRDANGDATNATPSGVVFDGRTSTFSIQDDEHPGQRTTIAAFLKANPSVNAITVDGKYIFVAASFFGLERAARASAMIHEGVVHRGFHRKDSEFDPGKRNRRTEGSWEINRKLNLYFHLKTPTTIATGR